MMDDDLFFDLFGDEGLLTPKSSPGSTDQDSGLGSPFGSNCEDASPLQWDSISRDGEFWDSILDDLPTDITDDSGSTPEQETYSNISQNNVYCYDINPINMNSNDPSWSASVLQEGLSLDLNAAPVHFDISPDSDKWKYASDAFQDASLMTAVDVPSPVDETIGPQGAFNPSEIMTQNVLPIILDKTSPTDTDFSGSDTSDIIPNVSPISNNDNCSPSPPGSITLKFGDSEIVIKGMESKSNQIDQNLVNLLTKISNGNKTSEVESIEIDEDMMGSPSSLSECKDCEPLSPVEKHNYNDKSLNYNDHDYAEMDFSRLIKPRVISNSVGPGLTLTAEEKKILAQEKLHLPENVPLTKDEEKVLKRVRRKIKNKQSAMESRKRRKEYISNLEHRVKHCTDLNTELKKKVEKLSDENKSLVSELKLMKDFIGKSFKQARVANMGTCLAVLVLSFALFVLPFNPLQFFDAKSENAPDQLAASTTVSTFRSRTLLNVDDHNDYSYQDEIVNTSVLQNNANYDHLEDGHEISKIVNLGTTLIIDVDNVLKKSFLFIAQQNITDDNRLQQNNTQKSHYITS